jgi:hypothetical protein
MNKIKRRLREIQEYINDFGDGFLYGVVCAFCVSLPIIYFYLFILR